MRGLKCIAPVTITASTVTSVPDPERDRDLGDRVDAPVQQRDVDQPHHRNERDHAGARQSLPDVARVLGEADVPGGDLQRPTEHELPDEQERHQPPEPLAPERLAQVVERSARPRHRRAQLAPHHAVADHDDERDDPARAWPAGPPSADMSSGIVMNGPTPIMFVMLSAVAGRRLKRREVFRNSRPRGGGIGKEGIYNGMKKCISDAGGFQGERVGCEIWKEIYLPIRSLPTM